MQQLTIFDDFESVSHEHEILDYIYSLKNGEIVEMDTVRESGQKYRYHSIHIGDKREFLVYVRKLIDGVWKEFDPISSGYWGIELKEIKKLRGQREVKPLLLPL